MTSRERSFLFVLRRDRVKLLRNKVYIVLQTGLEYYIGDEDKGFCHHWKTLFREFYRYGAFFWRSSCHRTRTVR